MSDTQHKHCFSVDTSCECGVMLSTYLQEIIWLNRDLVDALEKFMSWLDEGSLVRDITKDAEPNWAIKMLHFFNDLNKAKTALAKAKNIAP